MNIVTYTTPSGISINGIMLKVDRGSGMLEVAFDSSATKGFSIGWINPNKQIGKIRIHTQPPARWNHAALRLAASGKMAEARDLYADEERQRKEDRIKKETTS
jgi:hypothetical protein